MASSKVIVIGIDPGISGGIAVIQGTRFLEAHEMPVQQKPSGRSEVSEVDLVALAQELRARLCDDPAQQIVAAVEQVGAMPGQGVSGMFSLGDSFGCVRMFAALVGTRIERVAPVSWKKGVGLSGKDKAFALTRARALFPAAAPFLERKKDLGIADALLVAAFVAKHRT